MPVARRSRLRKKQKPQPGRKGGHLPCCSLKHMCTAACTHCPYMYIHACMQHAAHGQKHSRQMPWSHSGSTTCISQPHPTSTPSICLLLHRNPVLCFSSHATRYRVPHPPTPPPANAITHPPTHPPTNTHTHNHTHPR